MSEIDRYARCDSKTQLNACYFVRCCVYIRLSPPPPHHPSSPRHLYPAHASLSDKVNKMLVGNKCDLTTKKVVDYNTAKVPLAAPHSITGRASHLVCRNSPIPSRSPFWKRLQRTLQMLSRYLQLCFSFRKTFARDALLTLKHRHSSQWHLRSKAACSHNPP
jgi:hypothetical protein